MQHMAGCTGADDDDAADDGPLGPGHTDGTDVCTGPASTGPLPTWLTSRAGVTRCAVGGVDHDRGQLADLIAALTARWKLMPA